jgi:basic amino acid/polyamine antiporter, APA family
MCSMARITERGLRRTVGVPGLFATAYGNVGSSIYYALGLVALHALGLTPLVFMVAGGLFALTAKTYAEGAAMFPEAGGSSSFARHAFNELASFIAGWALTLDYIITIAISAFFVPHYLAAFFPALHHSPGDIFGGMAVIAILAAVNIRGLGESARLNLVLAIADLGTQVLLVLVGFVVILNPHVLVSQVHLGTAPTWSELIFALSLAMVAYTGIETVSNMAEEAHDPGRDVPKAVNMVLFAVLGVYAGISVVALSALPIVHDAHGYHTLLGTQYEADPVLGIVNNLGLGGALTTGLRYYVGVLAATILFIATNAGLIGISRLSWSLSEHRQLPGAFSSLHRRHRTPAFTIVFYSVIAGALLIPGQIDLLGNLYSFGAMLSFTTAHVSIVALRVRRPEVERPYRAPWNVRIRGSDIPLSACLGALGTFAAWISVVVLHGEARTVGIPWMLAGIVLFVVYRRRSGLDLTSPAKIDRGERPPDFTPLEYRSALVPIFGEDVSADALAAAARFVGPDATVDAVYVIDVPPQLPLDGPLADAEEHGRNVLESARLIGKRSGLHVRTSMLRTHNPGRTLVDEARRLGSEIVYLADAHAPASERALGPTAQYLLAERPCRIIVQTGYAARASGSPVRIARTQASSERPLSA